MTKLEIACFNAASALLAAKENVDRIELCEDYSQGGITPKIETLQAIKKVSDVPVYVMIRPRGGNFVYSEDEFERMKNDVQDFLKAGADGFVFGILKEDDTIDEEKNSILIQRANGLPCTFHRAFDRVENWKAALNTIIDCGFSTILTSGGAKTAMDGFETLKEMKDAAATKITILVGGGVRSSNAKELAEHFEYLHSACISGDSELLDIKELKNVIEKIKS